MRFFNKYIFSKKTACLLLLVITFVLRIIRIEDLFYFTYDEEVPALVARRLILWHHIPLIGGVTPFGFHLGPYFYWFYSAVLFLGRMNPLSWGYASAAISILTTFLIYKVGNAFGNKKLAITAATLWTFSFLANVYDRHLWALFWGPLFSLVIIYALYMIIIGKQKYTYVLGVSFALLIHADLSYLVLLLLTLIVWIKFKLPINKKTIISSSFILFSLLPLIFFDLRHDFSNTKPVLNFISLGRNNPGFSLEKFTEGSLLFPRTLTRLVYTIGDNEISKQYSYCNYFVQEKYSQIPNFFIFLSGLFLLSFIYWSFKFNKNPGWKIISFSIVLYFLGIQIYGTVLQADVFEHYLTGIFALLILALSKFIANLPKPIWLSILAFFIVFNLTKLSNAQNNMSLFYKRQAIEFINNEVGDRPFSVESLSTCWRYNGYRYLFTVFGNEPQKSYVDPNFAYLYGTTPIWGKHPKDVAAFVIHDYQPETEDFYKRYNLLKLHQEKNAIFGNIEVIIMDNSSAWFDQPTILKNPKIPINFD